MAKIVFKELTSNQTVLFPTNLLDHTPEIHSALPANQMVEENNSSQMWVFITEVNDV